MTGIEDSLLQYGPQGIMLVWFMLRLEKIVAANTAQLARMAAVVMRCNKTTEEELSLVGGNAK